MGDKTGISWTDATWNPIVGCSVVSPGCTNCYAMKQAQRIVRLNPKSHYLGTVNEVKGKPVWTGILALAPENIWNLPLRWKQPRRVFVNSMGDLFHEDVPDELIDRVFAIMALCPQHTFQVLTKRSKRMREYCVALSSRAVSVAQQAVWLKVWEDPDGVISEVCTLIDKGSLPNVWLGVSAEDQARWDERYPDLFATPAAVRFASFEPLIGRIDLCESMSAWYNATMQAWESSGSRGFNVGPLGKGLDWAIAGGESGPGHRALPRMEPYEHIMRMSQLGGFKFFFKQDSSSKSGQRGRASDALWACKEFPA